MPIRRATPEDAEFIRDLTERLTIERYSLQPSGFVDYSPPSLDNLRARLAQSPFCYVSVSDNGPNGFITAHTLPILQGPLFSEDPVVEEVARRMKGDEIYADHLGVEPELRGAGQGFRLMKKCQIDAKKSKLNQALCVVADHSALNTPILRLLGATGFNPDEEFSAKGLLFTIYRKNLRN